MNDTEILTQILNLQKESAIADTEIKGDIAHMKERIDKQDQILDKLADQSLMVQRLASNAEETKGEVKELKSRVTTLEGKPANNLLKWKERAMTLIFDACMGAVIAYFAFFFKK